MTLAEIQHFAARTVEEYPEITEQWRRDRLHAHIHEAFMFGIQDVLAKEFAFQRGVSAAKQALLACFDEHRNLAPDAIRHGLERVADPEYSEEGQ